jgi:ribosomal protein L3 glutamine methyltransferase
LPEIPFSWIEFKVGQMGIFAVERADLVSTTHRIKALADARG